MDGVQLSTFYHFLINLNGIKENNLDFEAIQQIWTHDSGLGIQHLKYLDNWEDLRQNENVQFL